MAKHSVCFIGDDAMLGLRDPEGFGWPMRLTRAERDQGHAIVPYVLAVEDDTTRNIAARWRAECEARLAGLPAAAVVFGFGLNDLAADVDGVRVPLPETLYLAEKIISEAAAWRATFWIGPPPVTPGGSGRGRQGQTLDYDPIRIRALTQGFAAIAARHGVPFFDLFAGLDKNRRYAAALRDGNGVLPVASGQALIAEQIGEWLHWRDWLDRNTHPTAYAATA